MYRGGFLRRALDVVGLYLLLEEYHARGVVWVDKEVDSVDGDLVQVSWGFMVAVELSILWRAAWKVTLYSIENGDGGAVLPRDKDVVILLVKGNCADDGIGGCL